MPYGCLHDTTVRELLLWLVELSGYCRWSIGTVLKHNSQKRLDREECNFTTSGKAWHVSKEAHVKCKIHCEMLECNHSINAQLYSQKLQCVADKIAQKCPEFSDVMFLHDNAWPHIAKLTCEKFLELDWEVFLSPTWLGANTVPSISGTAEFPEW